jgi:hypothetical protein
MFWKACHCTSPCEQAKNLWTYSKKSNNFSDSHSRKVEHWFCPCQWDIAGLACKKARTQWVLCQLMTEWRQQDWKFVSSYSCHEIECNDFLHSTVMEDKGWVHHYHLQFKSQSLEYHHCSSPRNKKSKTQLSTGKCILLENAHAQISGTQEASLSKEYMVKGTRINSETHVKTLKRLKQQINWNCQTPCYECCYFSGNSIGF